MVVMQTTAGFVGAPVSKGLLAFTTLVSLALSATKSGSLVSLSAKSLLSKLECWRLLTYQFYFSSAGELVMGLVLLYNFRLFERHWGSRKFGTFFVLVSVFSALIGALLLVYDSFCLKSPIIHMMPSGPYGFIFACMIQWYFEIPVSQPVRVMTVPLSDKTFVYLLAAQLALSMPPSSILASAIGIACGFIYRISNMRKLLLPKFVQSLCTRFILPLIESSPSHIQRQQQHRDPAGNGMFQNQAAAMNQGGYGAMPGDRRMFGAMEAAAFREAMFGEGIHRRPTAQPVPPPINIHEQLQTLEGMGFTDNAKNQRLLMQYGGNLQRVLDELLH